MIDAPSFAQTSETFHTFSMKGCNDPRMINWHVDRYARNFHFRVYYNVGAFPYAVERTFPIHVLRHDEPKGWPDREMMEQAWEEERLELAYMGFVQSDAYSLARKWFTNLRGDEWGRFENKPKQTICPNLSLTRYDWKQTIVSKFDSVIPFKRMASAFRVTETQIIDETFEPRFLTRKQSGKHIHGPSWEFHIPTTLR